MEGEIPTLNTISLIRAHLSSFRLIQSLELI